MRTIVVIMATSEIQLIIPHGPVLKWHRSDFKELLRRLQNGMQQLPPFFVPLPPADDGLIEPSKTTKERALAEIGNFSHDGDGPLVVRTLQALERIIEEAKLEAAIEEREHCIETLIKFRSTANRSRDERLDREQMGMDWLNGFYTGANQAVRLIETRRHTQPAEINLDQRKRDNQDEQS